MIKQTDLGGEWFYHPIIIDGKVCQARFNNKLCKAESYAVTIDGVIQQDYQLSIIELGVEDTSKTPFDFNYKLAFKGRKIIESVYPKVVMRSLLNMITS